MVKPMIRLPLVTILLLAGAALGGCASPGAAPGHDACVDCYVPGYRRPDTDYDRYYYYDRYYDPFFGPAWYGPRYWGWYYGGWPRYVIVDRPAPAPAEPQPAPERPAVPRPRPRDPGRVPSDEGPRSKPKPHYESPKRRKSAQQDP